MPPPPPSGNPFGGFEPPQPVKPAGGNPFGDAGYQPTSTNPYASPAGGDAYSYRPTFPLGSRPGLPWEAKGQNFNTWMETAKLCLLSPERAYSAMRLDGGLGQPMLYCGVGLLFGVVGQMIWYLPMLVLMSLFAGAGGQGGGGGEMAAMLGVQVVMQIVSGAFTVVAGATIGLIIAAAIGHVCLMIVGGARQPYETTLRVIGYAHGSTAWLNVIPFVGGLVALVWMIILEVIGFSRAHDIPGGKAVLAVLLPFIACCVLFGGIILVAVLAGAFANM